MRADDSPAPRHLDAVLELADELRPTWPSREQIARESPFGLVALGEEDDDGKGDGDQPNDEPEAPEAEAEDQPKGDEADEDGFGSLADYMPDDLPEDAVPAFEAAYKRMQGGYTRQRQEDTQALREARQAQEVVQGLMNPATRPQVAAALGIPLAQAEEEFGDEFLEDDEPSQQIGALWNELERRDRASEEQQAEQAETLQIANGIEAIEKREGVEFSDEEVDLLTLYSEEFRTATDEPDVTAAFKVFDSVVSGRLQRLTKRKKNAPRRPGGGAARDTKVDLTDAEQQQDAMERAVAAARASAE